MKQIFFSMFIFAFLPQITLAQCNYLQSMSKPNLVVNGDFSLGNTGFTSGYSYSTVNPLSEGKYIITTDASGVHFAFEGNDHTSGTGNLVVLNGSSTPTFIWNQTVSVVPNTYYNFSAWFKNIVKKPGYIGLPIATVELWINGVKVSKNITLPDYPDVWVLLDTSWFSGSSTTANLSIKNIGISLNGNDFGMDDIAFRACCPVGSKVNKSICQGSGINLNASGNGTFVWTPTTGLNNPASLNPIASPIVTTNYLITFTDGACIKSDTFVVDVSQVSANAGADLNICKRQSIKLNGSGVGSTFSWLPIKNIANNFSPTPSVNPDTTTTYYLTVTNGACISRDTVTVFVNPLDARITNNDTSFCLGDTIKLNGVVNGTNFLWTSVFQLISGGSLQPEIIPTADNWCYLTLSDGTCTITDSIKFTQTVINVDAGLDSLICLGDSLQLLGSTENGVTIRWSPKTGLDRDDVINPFAKPLGDITYTIEVTKGHCVSLDSVFIQIKSMPIVDAGPDQKVCMDAFTELDGTVSNTTSFLWSPAIGLSDIKILNPEVKVSSNLKFVLVGNNGNCISTDTVNITPNPKVQATFIANPLVSTAPAKITFTNTSVNAWFYHWDFGNTGGFSSEKNPVYTYENLGKYLVWLVAKDSLGCADSSSMEVKVVLEPYLKVPNVFTPNTDFRNDSFSILYNPAAFSFLEYHIYNRWGEHLYDTRMPNGAWWDGTFEGRPCPEGVYFFILYAETLFGKTYDIHGTVTLLR